ncbi:energy transducer TonB [Shimia sp. FJ5]|uniref:energy transducer TonB n=1 Tax=Shimia sp. FJ5 TaxID=3079054 RepID=UPI00293DBF72|nr:energy transducer TonB [Shimia sp. FJ5]MDV4145756.1 energy transducer TonB [Shimia sp. FJ5]
MHIGHYISGAAHVGLIGWALLGSVFQSTPEPFEVAGVAVITEAEFAALSAPDQVPQPETDVEVPVAPELSEAEPFRGAEPDEAPDQNRPESAEAAETEDAPDLSAVEVPAPAELIDEVPDMTPPSEDIAALQPQEAEPETVQPAPRVAPEPVAPPEPDVKIDDTVREAVTPEESPDAAPQEPEEATAPEAASTEIVTEAKELAPKSSVRPQLRPRRAAEAESAPEPKDDTDDAIAAALAEAGTQEQAETPAAPSGPPLTRGEKDALRISVQNCWVVDVGSQAANVTVTVAMNMTREGKVDGAISLLRAEGGDDQATKVAFEAARRAILRCQKGGYKLPIDKYEHWREIEITFNPEKMRLK